MPYEYLADDAAAIGLSLKELEKAKRPVYRTKHREYFAFHKIIFFFIGKENYEKKILRPLLDSVNFSGYNLKFFDMSLYADDDKTVFKRESFHSSENLHAYDFVKCHASMLHIKCLYDLTSYSERKTQIICFFDRANYSITSDLLKERALVVDFDKILHLAQTVYD